jgi:hypothetical protein
MVFFQNTAIPRDDRRRDHIFKKFTVESNLILPTNYPIDSTFHHHNGKGKSQIDYILFKGKTLNLQPSVSIMPFDAINTSDHTLIKVEITTQISKFSFKQNIIYLRFAFSVMMVECKVNWIVCRQYQVAFYSKLLKDAIPSSVVMKHSYLHRVGCRMFLHIFV